MPRLSIYVPSELHAAFREQLPALNVSRLLQDAIREVLGCRHQELVCARCAEPIDRAELIDRAMSKFYGDLMWRLEELLLAEGTVEGAARVAKDVALRHFVSAAKRIPLPRPSRAQLRERKAKQVSELPNEAASRARHPTARYPKSGAPAAAPTEESA